jgi:hypothetical protein
MRRRQRTEKDCFEIDPLSHRAGYITVIIQLDEVVTVSGQPQAEERLSV